MSLRRSFVVAAVLASCSAPARVPRERLSVKQIVEKSKPAIVQIDAHVAGGDQMGTGFAIDANGVIATNLHVVAGSSDIEIRLYDGTQYKVERIVGMAPEHDLALLGITPAKPLPILPLGDSDKIEAGDPVVAIGNPLGFLDYTVSDGLVSSIRDVPDLHMKLLQISAPISQGSSGGPVFNAYGEVIGTATAIATEGQNLNFAMPANYLADLIKSARPLTMAEFAKMTARPGAEDVQITRQVPDYDPAILDGCTDEQAVEVGAAIQQAIDLGAPLYNEGNRAACFKIYEGASLEWSEKAACPGVRQAFKDGLSRAATMTTDTEKAWALRDTFDGLITVIVTKIKPASP